jgi:hypothetical protein
MISIRLPWRPRARPSATLHEIPACSVKSKLKRRLQPTNRSVKRGGHPPFTARFSGSIGTSCCRAGHYFRCQGCARSTLSGGRCRTEHSSAPVGHRRVQEKLKTTSRERPWMKHLGKLKHLHKERRFLNVAFVLCRQLPTLPHTCGAGALAREKAGSKGPLRTFRTSQSSHFDRMPVTDRFGLFGHSCQGQSQRQRARAPRST